MRARRRQGPRRVRAMRIVRADTKRCWNAAITRVRACRSLPLQLAASTSDLAVRVRRGWCAGCMSSSVSIVDQCGMIPLRSGLRAPSGRTTNVSAVSKPLNPSNSSPLRPPRADRAGQTHRPTSCRSRSESGPLCVATTPRPGRCQTPRCRWLRTTLGPNFSTASGRRNTVRIRRSSPTSNPDRRRSGGVVDYARRRFACGWTDLDAFEPRSRLNASRSVDQAAGNHRS